MILTDEEINRIVREAAKGSAIRRDGTTSFRIARDIEQAILEKMGKPVAWMMVNETCPDLKPTLVYEPKTDWNITWKAVPLYALPEVK